MLAENLKTTTTNSPLWWGWALVLHTLNLVVNLKKSVIQKRCWYIFQWLIREDCWNDKDCDRKRGDSRTIDVDKSKISISGSRTCSWYGCPVDEMYHTRKAPENARGQNEGEEIISHSFFPPYPQQEHAEVIFYGCICFSVYLHFISCPQHWKV